MHLSQALFSPRKNGKRGHVRTGAEHLKPKKTAPVVFTGTVKYFDWQKSIGWITKDGDSRAVFVEEEAVQAAGLQMLVKGQRVGFNLVQDATDPNKWIVANLQVI